MMLKSYPAMLRSKAAWALFRAGQARRCASRSGFIKEACIETSRQYLKEAKEYRLILEGLSDG